MVQLMGNSYVQCFCFCFSSDLMENGRCLTVDKSSFPGKSVSLFTPYYLQYVINSHGSFLIIKCSVLFPFNNLNMISMSKQLSWTSSSGNGHVLNSKYFLIL